MVTWLKPFSTAICAVQFEVPAAVPEPPVLVTQVTLATATLSLAVPDIEYVASVVVTVVLAGEAIVSVGAMVSFPAGGAVGGTAGGAPPVACRVTVTVCE